MCRQGELLLDPQNSCKSQDGEWCVPVNPVLAGNSKGNGQDRSILGICTQPNMASFWFTEKTCVKNNVESDLKSWKTAFPSC